MQERDQKLSIKEKVGYALGDAEANITWSGVATFSRHLSSPCWVMQPIIQNTKNGRGATGLVYSAGSFSTKFGGGLAGPAIIGLVLSAFHYDGHDAVAIQKAVPGIVMLRS